MRLDGLEIARDGSTFCQLDEGRIAIYSLEAKNLSALLPQGWDAAKIAAVALSVDKAEEFHATVEGGKVKLSIPARRPVMVYRGGEGARKGLRRV